MAKTRPVTNPEWLRLTRRAIGLCDKYGVLMDQICGKGKTKTIVNARVAVTVMLRAYGLSFPMIGRFIHKNHVTALHGVRRAKKAGLPRPDGVHLGHDNQTERQDDSGRGVDSDGVRGGGGNLGGSGEQQLPHGDRCGCDPSKTQLYGSTGDRSGENSCGRKRRLPHRPEHDTDSQGD